MQPLSVDIAKLLQEAGLKWNPQPGDYFFVPGSDKLMMVVRTDSEIPSTAVWLPRLDQLLEILLDKGHSLTDLAGVALLTVLAVEKEAANASNPA